MACNLCQNTGFYKGRVCSCITGNADIPDELKSIFGDVFKDKSDGENAERGENCQEK